VPDKFQIVIIKGPIVGQVIDLAEDEVTLGREPGNVLTINDKGLSRFHARLAKTNTDYTVADLGSTNGTFVNGTAILSPRILINGDQISLGQNVILEYRKMSSSQEDGDVTIIRNRDETMVLPSRAALQEELMRAAKAHAEEHRALFSRLFEELWNQKNYAITRELVAGDFIIHGAGGQDVKQGPDGVADIVKIWHRAFPDGHMTIDDITTEGDTSVIRMTFRGTQTGEFYGVPASHKLIEVTSIEIDRVVGGKIAESWSELNMLDMMQQMGAIPTQEQENPNTKIKASITPEHVQEAYAALSSGNMDRIRQFWAEDMVWQEPGHNELSGWYYSRDEFLAFMARVAELSEHSFRMDMIAGKVLVAGDYSVDLTQNRGYRKDVSNKTLNIEMVHVLRWREGKVVEGKGAIFGDGATEYDQFWSRSPAVTPPTH
jgi:steroid delta-isomerase-like uncharacterized protein